MVVVAKLNRGPVFFGTFGILRVYKLQECPKCNATIEKDGGCNHMVCKRCKFDFCWVCLTAWEPHGSSWSVADIFCYTGLAFRVIVRLQSCFVVCLH